MVVVVVGGAGKEAVFGRVVADEVEHDRRAVAAPAGLERLSDSTRSTAVMTRSVCQMVRSRRGRSWTRPEPSKLCAVPTGRFWGPITTKYRRRDELPVALVCVFCPTKSQIGR